MSAMKSSSSSMSSLPGSDTLLPPSELSDSLSSKRSFDSSLECSYLVRNLLLGRVYVFVLLLFSKFDIFFSLLPNAFVYGLFLDTFPADDPVLLLLNSGFSSSSCVWITKGDFLFLSIRMLKSNTYWILLKLLVILFSIILSLLGPPALQLFSPWFLFPGA